MEEKEFYSPQEIAGMCRAHFELLLAWELGYGFKIREAVEKYNTVVPENVQIALGLDTKKLEVAVKSS